MVRCEDLDEAPEEIRALFHEHEAKLVLDCLAMAGITCVGREWRGDLTRVSDAARFIIAEYDRRYRAYSDQATCSPSEQ